MTPASPAGSKRDLAVHETAIPGLLIVELPVHGDARGWFKENWQRAKMTAAGLPDFGPVQHSVAHNGSRGVTRGFHAEPWDKFVSVVRGRVFGAWVDLRDGSSFGATVTLELGTDQAVFVPRGVGNSYQTLDDDTVYSYLVNDHWSPEAVSRYSYLNLADSTVAIPWPIPLDQATRSQADLDHPSLDQVTPMAGRRTLIVGAGGQLGRALAALVPEAEALDRAALDLADPAAIADFDFSDVEVVINAAAHTAVDLAETEQGRRDAWATNATAVAALAAAAGRHRFTLVHVSSDYVFDGSRPEHREDEPFSPLGVYGQTKAAGDLAASTTARHYVVRTSWVVGDGPNFVATMARLAREGATPSVVDDQQGRLTFTQDLAEGIVHLISSGAPYGTYNLTNSGPTQTWCEIAREVFALLGRDRDEVSPTTTADWTQQQQAAGRTISPRPQHSTLALDKIIATGFRPALASDRLRALLDPTHD